VLSALTAASGTASAQSTRSTTQHAAAGYTAGRYIVTFQDDPLASYDGYKQGFAATRPAKGRKLDVSSKASQAWSNRLVNRHDAALEKVGAAASKIYDFTVASNAVTVDLSAKQAGELAKQAGVLALTKDAVSHIDTTESPEFLGLTQAGGFWQRLGGGKNAGAGVVVGVIDTGIWPESAAFAGHTGIPVPSTWHGDCQAGENFPKTSCNDKLIGARYYLDGFGKKNIAKSDYLSPRDGEGHGSHTASTAAGDYNVPVSIDGNKIDDGFASGMAPGAKIAMYKVCWTGKPGVAADGCANSDSVAAINQAVADGVDVINYSIGGTSESSVLDPVEQAYRGAANAGVFVANSAGNSGPGASTLDHPSPWLMTVAAATFRQAYNVVKLGNGARYLGASTTPTMAQPAPFVTATSVKLATATDHDAALCFAGSLDPAKAAGKVVQCDRGVVDRIEKGFEVKRVGGVGMVMTNTSPNSLNGDYHPIPAVHLSDTDGAAVKAYLTSAGAGATAQIVTPTAAELAAAPKVPEITDFSSRGPSTTTGGDILKPDIAAPGNDVVAAVAPPFNHGRSWDFYSGTSMASPHIAGIGALLAASHPSWSPADIKSAIMTSAGDTVSSAAKPFAQGAGFVDPNKADDPGLVYPAGATDWRRYMVSLGVQFAPPNNTLTPLDGTDLNQASIASGAVTGSQVVTRTVRNVSSRAATYTATASVPGFGVVVTPSTLTLAPDESTSFTVTLTRTTATLGSFAIGSLAWSDGSHNVRSPIAVRPVALDAPSEVSGAAAAAGSVTWKVTPGYSGTLSTTVSGLTAATKTDGSVVTGPFDATAPAAGTGTSKYTVTVPAGTRVSRFSLDSADDTADLDLFVYKKGTATLVGLSASGSADEEATILGLAAGDYDVYVNGFATPGGSTAYSLYEYEVPTASAGNLTVTPVSPITVTSGTPVDLTGTWTGLDATKRYLGVVGYSGSEGSIPSVTLVSVG
jgi:hypothetical protein